MEELCQHRVSITSKTLANENAPFPLVHISWRSFFLLVNLWPESTVGNLPMNSRLLDYFAILQWWVSGFLCKVVCSAQPLANVHVLRRPSPSICLTCHMFYITEFLEKRVDLATLKSIACMCSGHTLTHIVHSNLKYISLSVEERVIAWSITLN